MPGPQQLRRPRPKSDISQAQNAPQGYIVAQSALSDQIPRAAHTAARGWYQPKVPAAPLCPA